MQERRKASDAGEEGDFVFRRRRRESQMQERRKASDAEEEKVQ